MSSTNTKRATAQVILILVVVAGAALLINSNVAGVQVYNVYPTISMLPTLEVGDLVVVHSVPFSSVHIGDVIVYAKPDSDGVCSSASEVIVHRVVNITSQGLITQGDDRITNPQPDEVQVSPGVWEGWPPIPASCVRGVVVVAIPYLGRITEAFPPPYNYILVAAILAFVFLLEVSPWGGKKGRAQDGTPPPADGHEAENEKAGVGPGRTGGSGSPLLHATPYIVANIVILGLIYSIFQDYAYRLSYWRDMSFTPHTIYTLFFFTTTATRGSTYIQGQFTLDWTQVLALILVIIDVIYLVGFVRRRRRITQTPSQ